MDEKMQKYILDRISVDSNGCWIWQQSIKSDSGYGQSWDGQHVGLAHRHAWIAWNGPVEEGLHLDHLCMVRACCNPGHLEPVTQAENNQRAWDNRRGTLCVAERHQLPRGARKCRECIDEKNHATKVLVGVPGSPTSWEVRQWLIQRGHAVGARGFLPKKLIELYVEGH